MMETDTAPLHHRSSSKRNALSNGSICEAFTFSSPDTNPAVIEAQSKTRLIREQHILALSISHALCTNFFGYAYVVEEDVFGLQGPGREISLV